MHKNLGSTFEHFWLVVGPKLLINVRTLAPRVANWFPKFDGILFFSALGPIQGHKLQHLLIALVQIEFFFSLFQP